MAFLPPFPPHHILFVSSCIQVPVFVKIDIVLQILLTSIKTSTKILWNIKYSNKILLKMKI